ncbi:MAG: hypothetical protein OHK0029_09970 [Armatimonadaceae bacterium]
MISILARQGLALLSFFSVPGVALAQDNGNGSVDIPKPPRGLTATTSNPELGAGLSKDKIERLLKLRANVQKLEEQGKKAFDQGNYKEAIQAFNESITLNPQSPQSYMGLAKTYTALGQFDDAIAAYRLLLYKWEGKRFSSYENSPHVLLPFALLLQKQGKWAEAVSVYNHTMPFVDKEKPATYQGRGYMFAVRVTQQFSPTVPENRRFEYAANVALAIGYYGGDNEKEIEQCLNRAVELQPRSPEAHYYMTQLLGRLKDADFRLYHLAMADRYGNPAVREAVAEAVERLHYMDQEKYPEVRRRIR